MLPLAFLRAGFASVKPMISPGLRRGFDRCRCVPLARLRFKEAFARARMAGVLPKIAACFALIFRPALRLRRAGFAMILRLSVIAIRYPFFCLPHGLRRAGFFATEQACSAA